MAWARTQDGAIGSALQDCLVAAVSAPSIHNTQPWLFRPFRGGVDVFADHSRRLGVIDPSGRELLISVGAALLNLRIAVLTHGRTPLQQILPAPVGPESRGPRAFRSADTGDRDVRLLAHAIPRRHTIRKPFSDDAVPQDVIDELTQAATVEGGSLFVTDGGTRDAVLSLVRVADNLARRDPRYWRELAEWTHPSRHRHDGVPPQAFGPWSALEAVPIRDFGLLEPVRKRTVAWFEQEPTIAVLQTAADTPADWLRAGEALERTLPPHVCGAWPRR